MSVLFNATSTTEIYTNCHTLSLHDARPISLDASALSPLLHARLRIDQLCRDGVLCRIARADFRETAGGRQRHHPPRATRLDERKIIQIGRASCRERVCQYV